jgi:ribosome biogenesis GTPase A
MLKTKKQIIEDLKLIDVIIEILDARIPLASQNPDIKQITANRKKIVVLNKSDLADEKETKKWVEYFKNQGIIAIPTDSNLGKGTKETLKAVQNLMQEEMEKAASKGRINKNIRIMICGIPNVGKSSFINRMINKKSAEVGNRPGVTKQKQWLRISSNIELLDTPGVLWPKFESHDVALKLAYTGSIKDELINKDEIAYNLIKYLKNNNKNELFARYKLTDDDFNSIIPEDDEALELMNMIARKRGAIISGGEIDYEKVSAIILNDFRTGKIGRVTLEKVNG